MKDGILKIIYYGGLIIAFCLPFPLALAVAYNLYDVQGFPAWVAVTAFVIMFGLLVFFVGKLVGRW